MNKEIIGRKQEQENLIRFMDSNESEFIAIYGRRRVGKTFLVRKLLGEHFAFYVTGMDNVTMQDQLLNFTLELRKFSGKDIPVPENWLYAFEALCRYIETLPTGKKIIFIDEGKIVESNTPSEFFDNPKAERLKEFLQNTEV